MGKRKHKNKEYSKDENLNNQNTMDFMNNKNLNPLELINYLGLNNNSNKLNSNELLKLIISGKLNGGKAGNPLMDLMKNINTDGVNMNEINKLSQSLNISNPQDLLYGIISNKLNLNNNNNNNDRSENHTKRRKNKDKDLENLEFLQSLREIVDPSKVELIDKIIAMYENGEI